MRNRFATLSTLSAADQAAGRTREFAGDGSPFLRVPGLVSFTAVRIGTTDIPLTERRKYPTNGSLTAFQDVDEPLFFLDRDAQGPVLLRSEISNNGLWQSGQPVYITGEWADATPTPAVTPQPVDFQVGDHVKIAQGVASVPAVIEAVLEDGTIKLDRREQPVTADKLTFVSRPEN